MTAPIPALMAVRAIEAQPSFAGRRDFRLGELLRLTVEIAADGTLQGADGRGLLLPLSGEAGQLLPGDVLLLRVLGQQPRLSLQLVERQPGGAGAQPQPAAVPPEDSPALRTDQAWLARQRLMSAAPPPPEPATLALKWRGQVFAELQQRAAWNEPDLLKTGVPTALEPDAAPLIFQLPGWQQQSALLRLLLPGQLPWPALDTEQGQGQAAADDGSSLMLCLGLELDGDWVQVLLLWDHGLLLHFAADEAATLERVRALLPAIARALASVPLRLRSCLLSLRSPVLQDAPPERLPGGLAETSCGALFRAAAELVKLLQQPASPRLLPV